MAIRGNCAGARALCCAIAVTAWLGITPHADAQLSYTFTDLGVLGTGDFSAAYDINDNGWIVGDSNLTPAADVGSFGHAFLWDPATPGLQDLGTLTGGLNSTARAINNPGFIVGHSTPGAGSQQEAFIWDPNTMTMTGLGTLGGDKSQAYDINDSNQVVGTARPTGSMGGNPSLAPTHAFFIDHGAAGTMQDLGTLGGDNSDAFGINSQSDVVGRASPGGSDHNAFLVENAPTGSMQDLADLSDQEEELSRGSTALAINDHGEIVGWLQGSGFNSTAFYRDSGPTDPVVEIGHLGSGARSGANDINNRGKAVGYSSTSGFSDTRGFIWSDALGMRDLNTLIDPNDPSFTDITNGDIVIQSAQAINARGQIVGQMRTTTGDQRAFLLTPSLPLPMAEAEAEVMASNIQEDEHDTDLFFAEAFAEAEFVAHDPLRRANAAAEAIQGLTGPIAKARSFKGRVLDITQDSATSYARAISHFVAVPEDPMNPPAAGMADVDVALTFDGILDVAGRNATAAVTLTATLHTPDQQIQLFQGSAVLFRPQDLNDPADLSFVNGCAIAQGCNDFSDPGFSNFLLADSAFEGEELAAIAYETFILHEYQDVINVPIGQTLALELTVATHAEGNISSLARSNFFNTAESMLMTDTLGVGFQLVDEDGFELQGVPEPGTAAAMLGLITAFAARPRRRA